MGTNHIKKNHCIEKHGYTCSCHDGSWAPIVCVVALASEVDTAMRVGIIEWLTDANF